jgi:CheY-like chemotaxis protein
VLVVEDDRVIREATVLLLEGWRCRVHAAASGAELDRLLATLDGAPDVVLADYRLPGAETGIEIIGRLRERYPGAAGILVSGDIAPKVLRDAQAAGLPFLHKPLRPARLRALLGALHRERRGASEAHIPSPAEELRA